MNPIVLIVMVVVGVGLVFSANFRMLAWNVIQMPVVAIQGLMRRGAPAVPVVLGTVGTFALCAIGVIILIAIMIYAITIGFFVHLGNGAHMSTLGLILGLVALPVYCISPRFRSIAKAAMLVGFVGAIVCLIVGYIFPEPVKAIRDSNAVYQKGVANEVIARASFSKGSTGELMKVTRDSNFAKKGDRVLVKDPKATDIKGEAHLKVVVPKNGSYADGTTVYMPVFSLKRIGAADEKAEATIEAVEAERKLAAEYDERARKFKEVNDRNWHEFKAKQKMEKEEKRRAAEEARRISRPQYVQYQSVPVQTQYIVIDQYPGRRY